MRFRFPAGPFVKAFAPGPADALVAARLSGQHGADQQGSGEAMETRSNGKRLRRSGRGGVTVEDVARLAGVSIASVSRVLNGSGHVGEGVRDRVRAAAETLGYVPHAAARALASHRSRIIGAVVPTIENPSFARAVEALQQRLAAAGYTLLLSSSNYDMRSEEAQVRALAGQGVDGLMLVGGVHDRSLMDFLAAKKIPFVNTWVLQDGSACVGFDNRAAGRMLADYLLDLGHVEIAVIAGVTRSNDRAAARVAGIRDALAARRLALTQERLIERPYKIAEGQLGLRALLAAGRKPTAVICGNDMLAFGALIECQAQGIAVPKELSVAGFDDMEFASQLRPPLTTVRIPADEIGARAAEYLIGKLAGETVVSAAEVAVNLIVRGSTAPPPHRHHSSNGDPQP